MLSKITVMPTAAVLGVTNNGVGDMLHVSANLVGPPGQRLGEH